MEEEKKKIKEKLRKKLGVCEKEKNEYLDGWKRARADLVNYKKDELQRIEKVIDIEKESILRKFILILDNFNRAEKETGKNEESDSLIEGFLKIKEQMERFLKDEGVTEINAEGKEFDPLYHEAVETVESESEESGTVITEIEKGYMFKDRVLRPSKVRVAK